MPKNQHLLAQPQHTLICGVVSRLDGSFSSIFSIKSRSSALIFVSLGKVNWSFFIFSYSAGMLLAKNGTFPKTNAYSVAPNAHMSDALPLYEYLGSE